MLVRVFRITALKPTARAPGISSCTYHLVPSDALLLSSRLIPAFLFFATLCTFLHPRQLLSRTAPQSYVPLLPQEDEVFFPLLERSLQHTRERQEGAKKLFLQHLRKTSTTSEEVQKGVARTSQAHAELLAFTDISTVGNKARSAFEQKTTAKPRYPTHEVARQCQPSQLQNCGPTLFQTFQTRARHQSKLA